ncbi:MAG: hypothetical protein ACREHF_00280 [Rhizomicrobium sp.]
MSNRLNTRMAAIVAGLLLNGCAAGSSDLLTTSSQVFQFSGGTVTIGMINSLSGCFPLTGVIQNNSGQYIGYVYTDVLASAADGQTVADWGINFPPTVAGGSAQAVEADNGLGGQTVVMSATGVAGLPCSDLQFHIKAR